MSILKDSTLSLHGLEPCQARGKKLKRPDQDANQCRVSRGGQRALTLMMSARLPRLKPMQDQYTILEYAHLMAFHHQLSSCKLPPATRGHHEYKGFLSTTVDRALGGTLIWSLHFRSACLPRLNLMQDQYTILTDVYQAPFHHRHSSCGGNTVPHEPSDCTGYLSAIANRALVPTSIDSLDRKPQTQCMADLMARPARPCIE